MSRSPNNCGEQTPCSSPEETLSECSVPAIPCYKPVSSTLTRRQSCCRSRPTTPDSVQSSTNSRIKFCTSQTCQNSKNCKEPSSPYCSYGLKNGNSDNLNRPLCPDTKPDHKIPNKRSSRTEDTPSLQNRGTQLSSSSSLKGCCAQRAPQTPCMAKPQKLNKFSASNQDSSNVDSQSPCRKSPSKKKPHCTLSSNENRRQSIPKTSDSTPPTCSCKGNKRLNEQNTNAPDQIPSNHDVGVQTSMTSLVPDPNKSQRASCDTPTVSNKIEKADVGASSTTCVSASCKEKQQVQCKCQYPPTFKQFSCTGKITGNCDCCCKK